MIQEKRPIDANSLYDIIEARYKNATGEAREKYREVLDLICDQDTLDMPTAKVVEVDRSSKQYSFDAKQADESLDKLIANAKADVVSQILDRAIATIGQVITKHIDGDNSLIETEVDIIHALTELKEKIDPIVDQKPNIFNKGELPF